MSKELKKQWSSKNDELHEVLSSDDLLWVFARGGLLDKNTNPTYLSEIDLKQPVNFPLFCLNKKKFIEKLPELEFSHNIQGDLFDDNGELSGFSMKMALFTIYASIANNRKKFSESKEVLEELLVGLSPMDLNENQYIMLSKLEKFAQTPTLRSYIANVDELEAKIKEKYNVVEIANLFDINNFIIRTSTYEKKLAKKDHLTIDMFDDKNEHDVIKKSENTVKNFNDDNNTNTVELKSHKENVKHQQVKDIINELTSISTQLIDKDYTDQIAKEKLLYSLLIKSNDLLNMHNSFNLTKAFEKINENNEYPEIIAIEKALMSKHKEQKLNYDDYENHPELLKYNLIIANNSKNISVFANIKTDKKVDYISGLYLTPDAIGETPIQFYLNNEILERDFDNSFGKSLSSGRSVSGLMAKIFDRELSDSNYDMVFDKIISYKDYDINSLSPHEKDQFNSLFAILNNNPQFIDDLNVVLDEIVTVNPKFAEIILENSMNRALLDGNVENINSLLKIIKTQELSNPVIDGEFVKKMYEQSLNLPKSIVKELQVTQDDVEKFDIKITKKQADTIKSMKI